LRRMIGGRRVQCQSQLRGEGNRLASGSGSFPEMAASCRHAPFPTMRRQAKVVRPPGTNGMAIAGFVSRHARNFCSCCCCFGRGLFRLWGLFLSLPRVLSQINEKTNHARRARAGRRRDCAGGFRAFCGRRRMIVWLAGAARKKLPFNQ